MKIVSIDQSLSKTAVIVWDNDQPRKVLVFRTGNNKVKTKLKGVNYYNSEDERIEYIASSVFAIIEEESPDHIVMESLSYGSIGNATRDLAGLYYVMRNVIFFGFPKLKQIHAITPQSIKKLAREYLPVEQRTVPKPSGKEGTNLRKMEKKDMISAVPEKDFWIFDGLKMSGANSGMDDVADAYFLGLAIYNNKKEVL